MSHDVTILSVNVGQAGTIAAKSGLSGIFKRPAAGAAAIGAHGVEGDVIVDRRNHGGPDQAVYAYCAGDYAWWADLLGRPMPQGTFGENLTLDSCLSAAFAVGDVLAIGSLRLEVTAPRIPCETLEARIGQKGFVRTFLKAGRPGPYFRVLAPGRVAPGDRAALHPFAGPRTPIAKLTRPGPLRRLPAAARARILAAPVHRGLREMLEG